MASLYRFDASRGIQYGSLTGLCPHCEVAASFKAVTNLQAGNNQYRLFMQCLHCEQGIYVHVGVVGGFQVLAVFPQVHRKFPNDRYDLIKGELRAAIEEAYAAFGAGAYTLTGLGCRVVLERLVQGLGQIDPVGLEERLERLKDSYPDLIGPLTNAEVIRLVGNVAAHNPYRELTANEAFAMIEFTESILIAVCIAPAKREEIKRAFADKSAQGLQDKGRGQA